MWSFLVTFNMKLSIMIQLILSNTFFLATVFYIRSYLSPNKKIKALILSYYIFFIIMSILFISSNYFTGDGVTESVIYTLFSNTEGAGINKYILPSTVLIFLSVVIFAFIVKISKLKKENKINKNFSYTITFYIFLTVALFSNPGVSGVLKITSSRLLSLDNDFNQYYIPPSTTIDTPPKNIIYIYGESLERTYFDKKTFPGLTNELSKIKDNSIDFSNTIQLPGTDYTIAGIVASQCGIPLFSPFHDNALGSLGSFFPSNICLGDILKKSGYNLYFYQGADLEFGGKGLFFKNHGFDHVYGRNELNPFVKDKQYINDWGWYDDTLLDIAYNRFTQLAQENKPFGLFLLTVDTHHPDGFISKSCTKKDYYYEGSRNQSLSAVACSQQNIASFIEKVKNSGYFKNTLIVVQSDHLAMNNTAYNILTKQQRKNLFFIIDSENPQGKVIDKERSSLDNGVTILDMLGGAKELGLGRSSLTNQSLFKEFKNLDKKINSWKNSIVSLWGFPKEIDKFTIDQKDNSFITQGYKFEYPILFKINKDSIDPRFDKDYSVRLSKQLAEFNKEDNFLWVDECYRIMYVFKGVMKSGLCIASGRLAGPIKIQTITSNEFKDTLQKDKSGKPTDNLPEIMKRLNENDKNIKYNDSKIVFKYPGTPVDVDSINGLSWYENWGRWSDSNEEPYVTIKYKKPLPKYFTIKINASIYGNPNDNKIAFEVGKNRKIQTMSRNFLSYEVSMRNEDNTNTLIIRPLKPISPLENNDGVDIRKLGIALIMLEIKPINK